MPGVTNARACGMAALFAVFLPLTGCVTLPGNCNWMDSIPNCTALIQSGRLTPQEHAEALYRRGYIYLEKHRQYDRAFQDYDEAIQTGTLQGTGLAFALAGRGSIYYRNGEYDRAIDDYDKAEASIGLNIETWNRVLYPRAKAYYRKGDRERANSEFAKAMAACLKRYEYRAQRYQEWCLGIPTRGPAEAAADAAGATQPGPAATSDPQPR